ncbi:hypothetical protein EDB85DRAFT_1972030, partial [Lactarius pseudohatsudake]
PVRMDAEVLCPSFDVHLPTFSSPPSSDRTCRGQSFAKRRSHRPTRPQFVGLLDSTWQKVAGTKDSFERPFRTGTAGDALPTLRVSASASTFATASTSAPARPMIAAAGAVAAWAGEWGLAWSLSLRPPPGVDCVLVAAAPVTTRAFQAE